MSRNLGRTDCHQCGGPITLDSSVRPISKAEAGCYFDEYGSWLKVSSASCAYCATAYLAWMTTHGDRFVGQNDEIRDLSYRGSFNDEPSATDVSQERVEWVLARQLESEFMLDQLLRRGPLR